METDSSTADQLLHLQCHRRRWLTTDSSCCCLLLSCHLTDNNTNNINNQAIATRRGTENMKQMLWVCESEIGPKGEFSPWMGYIWKVACQPKIYRLLCSVNLDVVLPGIRLIRGLIYIIILLASASNPFDRRTLGYHGRRSVFAGQNEGNSGERISNEWKWTSNWC